MINMENVCKSFMDKSVLSDLSLHLARSESLGLLGESGSGKSTILKIISGLVSPDSGRIEVGSSRIGYGFQEHRLIPWKTAHENIAFSLRADGIQAKRASMIAADYLERVELGDYGDYYPSQLSGGMCQRVSIARAFAVEPEILLMDEPFSALDPELTHRMNMLVGELRENSGASMIYVTHNESELKDQVDYIARLKDGVLQSAVLNR